MMVKLTIAAIIASLVIIPTPVKTAALDVPEELYNQYRCMKLALHYEARGEGTKGMMAVANVILNRVNSSRYPNDICSVVTQKYKSTCQFSWYCDKQLTRKEPNISFKARFIAYEAVVNNSLKDITGGALLFHANTIEPYWASTQKLTRQIGNHIFYR
jgi:N-acetylmuramoyl-L-alanine amidase